MDSIFVSPMIPASQFVANELLNENNSINDLMRQLDVSFA